MERIKILHASERGMIKSDWGTLTWNASEELGNAKELTVGQ